VLATGDRLPEVTVFRNPGEPVALRELVADGPVLLVFYLFDWSST
jgi:peroxiredoxin